jgi:hypothetical protein
MEMTHMAETKATNGDQGQARPFEVWASDGNDRWNLERELMAVSLDDAIKHAKAAYLTEYGREHCEEDGDDLTVIVTMDTFVDSNGNDLGCEWPEAWEGMEWEEVEERELGGQATFYLEIHDLEKIEEACKHNAQMVQLAARLAEQDKSQKRS